MCYRLIKTIIMLKVIKLGSSSLHNGEKPRLQIFESIAAQIFDDQNLGKTHILVSSGAIAFGAVALGQSIDRADVHGSQVQASVGQPLLMDEWAKAFTLFGKHVGQVLVTPQELKVGSKRNDPMVKGVLLGMIKQGIVPIVNENDSVAADEIKLGDNDQLAARVGLAVGAGSVHLLGTAGAVFSDYPSNQTRIKDISLANFVGVEDVCQPTNDPQAVGGMTTKLEAARLFLDAPQKALYVASAEEPYAIVEAEIGKIGTKIAT